jgi:hypothetical protein
VALPKSVKLTPKMLKPIKIWLQKPLEDTLSNLISHIRERAVNGAKLAGLIKAFKVLISRSLLVYPITETAKEELS